MKQGKLDSISLFFLFITHSELKRWEESKSPRPKHQLHMPTGYNLAVIETVHVEQI